MGEEKLALITGASNGIGLALAEEFAANGYDLVIVARDEKKLSAARECLQKKFPVNVYAFSADLSEYDQITNLQVRMNAEGLALSALVINAGQGLGGAFIGSTVLEKELQLIRLNIDAVVHLSKLFIPQLVKKGCGHVLVTSSLSGSAPIPFEAVYGASKAFVNSFFYAIRNELMGSGVSMTLLMPGATETNFFNNAGQASTTVGSMKKDDPKEVAKRAWYALMTGHEFVYGSEYAEYEGEVMNRMMSESHKAQRHRIISEPDSAMKK
ncbi:SDR family NAD(P)-dependent oxidoreductase [Enterobacter hormaechei]